MNGINTYPLCTGRLGGLLLSLAPTASGLILHLPPGHALLEAKPISIVVPVTPATPAQVMKFGVRSLLGGTELFPCWYWVKLTSEAER